MQISKEHKIIKPGSASLSEYLTSIWRNRHLVSVLARRDIKVKYAQTFIGIGWTLLQPLTTLLIFLFFFNYLLHVTVPGTPYPLFVFSGMLAWYFFNYVFFQGSGVLMEKQDIIKRIDFPKIILPFSKVMVGLMELAISLLVLAAIYVATGSIPPLNILLFPLVVLMVIPVIVGPALWISALTVQQRDLIHFAPYLVNFGMWLTPVFYPTTLIPQKFAFILFANPIAAVLELFRFCLLPGYTFNSGYVWGFAIGMVIFVSGFFYFKKIDKTIPDYL